MKKLIKVRCFLIVLMISCGSGKPVPSFTFAENNQGIELREKGKPVFFYQRATKSKDGKYLCNNYLHPLYSLNGDTLTEEFPVDHPFHRGIFWAWHQIFIDGESVGDGWIMENIEQEIVDVQTSVKDNNAKFNVNVLWKSQLFKNKTPFLNEQTTITVHPFQDNMRQIDFAISLKAVVPGLEIGGSDDEKGYGGFSTRLKCPADLTFTSAKGPVTPQLLQIEAGPWMDFSASFGKKGEISGVTIICHSNTPNYPAPWILRSEKSMQNIVFPGKNRIQMPMNEPVALYYRLIIHNGDAGKININKLQSEYSNSTLSK